MSFQYLKRASRKAGEGLLIRAGNNRMRGNGLNLEEDGSRLDIRKKFFTVRVVALEQVAQRGCGCPLPGGIQDKAGWVFEQSVLVGGVPPYSRGLEIR